MHIRMGTRGSALALAQCNEVKALLEKAYPQHSFEICVITTKGDAYPACGIGPDEG